MTLHEATKSPAPVTLVVVVLTTPSIVAMAHGQYGRIGPRFRKHCCRGAVADRNPSRIGGREKETERGKAWVMGGVGRAWNVSWTEKPEWDEVNQQKKKISGSWRVGAGRV